MARSPLPRHDNLYHALFGHPGMVAQLLRGFVAGPWLDEFDLGGMERLNAKFHARDKSRRDGDMVWRIPRRGGGEAYLLLLLEFQSTQDRWMALRILVYSGLLWQHLVKEKRLPPDGMLPPVLPVVLYDGDPRWVAPVGLRDVVGLAADSPLWRWQPDMRYIIVDEGASGGIDVDERDGLTKLLFRLENSPTQDEAVALAGAVADWFARHPGYESLRSIFAQLLGALLRPLAPDVRVPEDLLEIRSMLATRVEVWRQQLLREGELRGEQRGELRGELRGEQRGEQRGELRGEQIGRQRGAAALLIRQMSSRFGQLPQWVHDRVAAADMATLEEWSVRVLAAQSLDDIFTA